MEAFRRTDSIPPTIKSEEFCKFMGSCWYFLLLTTQKTFYNRCLGWAFFTHIAFQWRPTQADLRSTFTRVDHMTFEGGGGGLDDFDIFSCSIPKLEEKTTLVQLCIMHHLSTGKRISALFFSGEKFFHPPPSPSSPSKVTWSAPNLWLLGIFWAHLI